jgi:hypothetical protein
LHPSALPNEIELIIKKNKEKSLGLISDGQDTRTGTAVQFL